MKEAKRGATTAKTQETPVVETAVYAISRGRQLSEPVKLNPAGRAKVRTAPTKHCIAATLKVTSTKGATISKRVTVV